MSRVELSVNTHVFHASLRFGSSILVEEKDKKKFLDFALRSQGEPDISILSFVVLDDEVHFLFGLIREKTDSKSAIYATMKNYREFLEKEHCQANDRNSKKIALEAVEGREKILDTCRKIHLLPVERGYVNRAKDYWWSSFQSYRGTYQWKGIDTFPILHCFMGSGKRGRSMFLKYHRQES